MKCPYEIGDRVYHVVYGWLDVTSVQLDEKFGVMLPGGLVFSYLPDGRCNSYHPPEHPSIFLSPDAAAGYHATVSKQNSAKSGT